MDKSEKRNQNLMAIIKKMHGVIEESDLEKARASQEHVAKLSFMPKELTVEEIDLDGMYCEWIRPDRPHNKRRVILYCHGGGYTTGSASYSRSVTMKLSSATSMDLLCFNYRLAPEAVYPTQLNDALKAWDYLMLLGYGAKDVILIGDSAGGNLALSLTLNLKETGRILPGAIVLFSPWTDMTLSGKSYSSKKKLDPVLTKEYIELCVSRYIYGEDTMPKKKADKNIDKAKQIINNDTENDSRDDLASNTENVLDDIKNNLETNIKSNLEANTDGILPETSEEIIGMNLSPRPATNSPLVSPLFGNHEDFPPVYIQVGTNEILYNDAEALYKKLLSENVRVQFDAFKGMWHVFQMTPLKTASEALEKTAEFIFNVVR